MCNIQALLSGSLVAAFLSTSALAAEPVDEPHADIDHNRINGVRMDVHADLGTYGGLGVGIRGDIPLVPEGFIDGVDDEFAISPGADVYLINSYSLYSGGPYVIPVIMAQWNFYLTDQWSVFPEAGLAMFIGNADYLPGNRGVYVTVATGAGARYHFNERNSLLMRASWPTGLQVGMTF